jgi:hypothetical protein
MAFGAAAAVGGLGGFAQIGNNGSVFTPSTQIAFIINMLFIPSMTQAIFGGAAGLTSAAPTLVGGGIVTAAIKGGA